MRTEQTPPPTRRAAASKGSSWRAQGTRRRRWPFFALVLALVAGTAGAWWLLGRPDQQVTNEGLPPEARGALLAMAVTGEDRAFVAVVGRVGDHRPAAAIVPGRLVVEIPGAGGGTAAQAARLPAPMVQLTVANLLATEVHHVAVFDLDGLAALVDVAGGLTVDVPGRIDLDGTLAGPGPTLMDGATVVAYLAGAPPFALEDRFAGVLDGLLGASGLRIDTGVPVETDDRAAVEAVLRSAAGATVEELPSVEAGGNLLRPDLPGIEEFLGGAFGLPVREVVDLLVLNGNGAPGMGEAVARRVVGEGFRLVASDNLASFDFPETEIRVQPGFEDAGERVRGLLGVGKVIVSEQGSGLAPISVVVGLDFVEG